MSINLHDARYPLPPPPPDEKAISGHRIVGIFSKLVTSAPHLRPAPDKNIPCTTIPRTGYLRSTQKQVKTGCPHCLPFLLAVAEQDPSTDGRGRGRRSRPERHGHGGDVVLRPPFQALLHQGVAGEGKVLSRHLQKDRSFMHSVSFDELVSKRTHSEEGGGFSMVLASQKEERAKTSTYKKNRPVCRRCKRALDYSVDGARIIHVHTYRVKSSSASACQGNTRAPSG